jgi:2-polyprenyl-3-methyl-5-hydroxy-6-metoxy-1,4-benzoquinol methylase
MKENKHFWNSYASEFDSIYGTGSSFFKHIINILFRQAIKLRFERTLASIPDDKVSVVDIGCGPGHYCFALAGSGKRSVLGLDFSEQMIAIAKNHTAAININGNLDFKLVSIDSYSPAEKFDYSIMMGFIEYFENPEAIIRKAVSITNKKIFISFPVSGGILGWQRKIRYRSRCYLKMYSRKQIEDLMISLDIKNYSIIKLSRDYFVTISLLE